MRPISKLLTAVSVTVLTMSGCDSQDAQVSSDRSAPAADAQLTPEEDLRYRLEQALARLDALEQGLSEEIAERKAADEAIRLRVTELETGIATLRSTLKSEISRLDESLAETSLTVAKLSGSVDSRIAEAKSELLSEIQELKISTDNRLDALNSKVESEIAGVKKAIEEAQQAAAQKYATKAQLEALSVITSRLDSAQSVLDQRIDANALEDERLAQLIETKVRDLAEDFESEIDRLDVADQNFAGDLKRVADEAAEQIAAQVRTAEAKAAQILDKIAKIEAYNLDSHARIETEFQVLKTAIAGLSYSNTALRDSLNRKYAELAEADEELRLEFQLALVTGLKQEQDARMQLSQSMEAIKKRIEEVAAVANAANTLASQGVTIAKTNEARIASLSEDMRNQIKSLEAAFTNRMESLALRTEQIFSRLDQRYQQQAGELSARLADAELKISQMTKNLSSHVAEIPNMPGDAALVFDYQTRELRDQLIRSAGSMAEGVGLFEAYFLDAINYIDETAQPNPEIARRFTNRVVNSGLCTQDSQGPVTNTALGVMEQPSAGGYQWYRHLSAAYMRQVFFGPRDPKQNDDSGSIDLGIQKVDIRSLGGYALLSLLPNYFDSVSTASCQQVIDEWAKNVLYGTDDQDQAAVDLRRKLLGSRALTIFARGDLSARLTNLLRAAAANQTAIENIIKLKIVDADISKILFGESGESSTGSDSALIPKIAFTLGEVARMSRNQARLSAEFENMKTALMTHAVAQNTNTEGIRNLENQLAELGTDIRGIQQEQASQINSLANTLKQSLSLMSVLARKVGRADVAMAAVALQRSIPQNTQAETTTGVGGLKSVRYSFPYIAAGNDQLLSTCYGPVIAVGGRTVAAGTEGCAGLKVSGGAPAVVIYRNGREWFRFTEFSSRCKNIVAAFGRLSQPVANMICSRAGVIDGPAGLASIQSGKLLVEALAPWHETALNRLKLSRHGQPIPANQRVETNFILSVGDDTKAAYFKFWSRIPLDPYFIMDSATIPKTITNGIAYYDMPGSFVFSKTSQGFWKNAQISSLDAELRETATVQYALTANQNDFTLYTYSPIVINLDHHPRPRTTRWVDENVRFDLNGDGKIEQVGWVAPGSYLLALDLNENGKIDDGRELFGTATLLPNGLRAENGYKALDQYDDNQDGIIDREDRIFSKLLLWADNDQNGQSTSQELLSLNAAKISSIGVRPQQVTGTESVTHEGSTGNRVYYKSRVFGPPACGTEGCQSFDVWFNSHPLSDPTVASR